MPLTLASIPGFADLPDTSLVQDTPALGVYMAKISENAAFGMVRMEVVVGSYTNGQTVGLPVSPVDGYNYSRAELNYLWAVQSTVNPSTGWITGPDTLWYGAWLVDQTTGLVSTLEWYRRSGSHANPAQSNDGTLVVFTVAQRQRTTMIVESLLNSYTDISDSTFSTDAPLNQSLLRSLNDNAKFSALNGECIYMGEFTSGQTVGRATSPVDGYQYTYAEMTLQASWRWTVSGSAFGQPAMATGQLAPIKWSINASTGVVSITVDYVEDSGSLVAESGFGRIAVFAFCSRSDLMSGISGTANAFSEIDVDTVFVPGTDLRASTASQLNKNLREAACSPEFFGPTEYASGDTIPTPTSAIDSYAYSRAELTYIWEWSDTTPASGTHLRTAAWRGSISQTTGVVSLQIWRLADGGPIVQGLESGQHLRVRVTTVAIRGGHAQSTVGASASAPSDIGSVVVDNNPPDIQPYAIPVDIGDGALAIANQSLLRHIISGDLNSVIFASGLPTSAIKARIASTGTYVITLKRTTTGGSPVTTTIGTITFSAGNLTAALSFSSTVTGLPFEEIEFVGQATPDATLSGIYGTLSGTRT